MCSSWLGEPLPDLFPALATLPPPPSPTIAPAPPTPEAITPTLSPALAPASSTNGREAVGVGSKRKSAEAPMSGGARKRRRHSGKGDVKKKVEDDGQQQRLRGSGRCAERLDGGAECAAWFAEAAANERQLVVAPTGLPLGAGELGLFAGADLPSLAFLVEYRGERLTKAQLDALYGDDDVVAPYTMVLHDGTVIDAARADKSSVARYANDCLPNTLRYLASTGDLRPLCNNAAFVEVGGRIFIRAILPIRAGDEILVSYGADYWGAPQDQVRTAVIDHLCARAPRSPEACPFVPQQRPDAPPPLDLVRWVQAHGATAFEIATAVSDRVRLAMGDAVLRWKRIVDEVQLALNAELHLPPNRALFYALDRAGQFDRPTDSRLFYATLAARTQHARNRARSTITAPPPTLLS
jgi:hypothetical protein